VTRTTTQFPVAVPARKTDEDACKTDADARMIDTDTSLADMQARFTGTDVIQQPPLTVELLDTIANLQVALSTRDLIGQAKGVLIERHKISAEEAFGLLRLASQANHVKLRDVADELLWTGQLPGRGGQWWRAES
jgi:hypothetical protein